MALTESNIGHLQGVESRRDPVERNQNKSIKMDKEAIK